MHDQLANTVEKEEGITAGLWVSWATRFCQNAGARRGRSSSGNGGRLRAALWEARKATGAGDSVGQVWVASRRGWPCQGAHGACPARSGERRRVAPRGQRILNRSAMTVTDRFLKTAIQVHRR